MSYTIFFDSLLRSLFIALTALGAGMFIVKILLPQSIRINFILIPLFLCFFVPPVAVGYGYTTLSYQLIQYPQLHEYLYIAIMVSRLVGPAVMLLCFLPVSTSRESTHCFFLSLGTMFSFRYVKYCIHAYLWRYAFIFTLLFLFAFNEFELASMMNIEDWSVSLFDAHAQGVEVFSALKLHFLPFTVQLAVIALLIFILEPLRRSEPLPVYSSDKKIYRSYSFRFISIIFIFLVCIFISFLFPGFMILKSALRGGSEIFHSLWMFKEIMNSLLFAAFATLGGFFLVALLKRVGCFKHKTTLLLIFFPLLVGILPLSLMILELFQLPLVNVLYNSPVPLIIALVLWGVPFIIILQILPALFGNSEAVHSAELMLPFSGKAASELLWKLKFSKTAWIFFLVFTLIYFNFTAATILAPIEMTTITERFYNLMHYGESEKLSATVCITMIIPLLLFFLMSVIFRFILKRWHRVVK